MDEAGEKVAVEERGLVVSEEYPFLATSADGFVENSSGERGVSEIKCPVSTLTIPSLASAQKNFYLQCGTDGNLHLKRSHPYFTQSRFEMAVTKRDFVDFVVFTLSQSGYENIFVERITFSEEFWSKTLLLALHKFFLTL